MANRTYVRSTHTVLVPICATKTIVDPYLGLSFFRSPQVPSFKDDALLVGFPQDIDGAEFHDLKSFIGAEKVRVFTCGHI